MSTANMANAAFNPAGIGREHVSKPYSVTREGLAAYAAATNETWEPYLNGDIATPVFAVVPAFPSMGVVIQDVVPADILMKVVHGEQDMSFHQPIRPGMELVTTSSVIGYRPKRSGTVVDVRATTRAQDGVVLTDQILTLFFRGVAVDAAAGIAPSDHVFPEALREMTPAAEVVERFDTDQTFRYAEASGDRMPIHLDDEMARAVGLPGIIIHGLCTMCFTARAVVNTGCPDEPERLRRLAVRFAKPCLPGQQLTTHLFRVSGGWAFEATSEAGDVVITDGCAEIAETAV
jgi:acyl dehydratase